MLGRLLCVTAAVSLGLSATAVSTTAVLAAGQQPTKSRPAHPRANLPADAPGDPDPLTPVEANRGPLLAPGAAEAMAAVTSQASAQPAAEADAIVIEVRKRLATATERGNAETDRAGLVAYYAQASQPVWTSKDGFTPKGKAVIAEIGNAEDWGLNPSAFELPTLAAGETTSEAAAAAEIKLGLAVLKYARHARGGRLDPQAMSHLFDYKLRFFDAKSVMFGIAAAGAADAYLHKLHPQHPQFEKLRQAWVAARGRNGAVAAAPAEDAGKPDVKIPAGPRLKQGDKHAQIALVRQRLGVAGEGGSENVYDEALAKAVMAYQSEHGLEPNGILSNDTRTALNGSARRSSAENTQRLLVNMERWRWLPDDLGAFHVWDSIPEQMTRVYDNGRMVFTEKIVVGKVTTPTPFFTANMQFVIFHPEWGVPDGIKVNELAPLLRNTDSNGGWFFGSGRTASSVLKAVGGLRPSINGRPVDPDSVNWSSIDIRQVQFTQPAGGPNVLGEVKFRFPNQHDVYMHDTPERNLFGGSVRAFSHGCMRVQNPIRFAEVLLGHDKGWLPEKVQSIRHGNGAGDIKLSTEIPVHVTYFTTTVDDNGKVHNYADIYGLDSRIASALAGHHVDVVASIDRPESAAKAEKSSDPSVRAERQIRPRPRVTRTAQSANGAFNPFSGLFGN